MNAEKQTIAMVVIGLLILSGLIAYNAILYGEKSGGGATYMTSGKPDPNAVCDVDTHIRETQKGLLAQVVCSDGTRGTSWLPKSMIKDNQISGYFVDYISSSPDSQPR